MTERALAFQSRAESGRLNNRLSPITARSNLYGRTLDKRRQMLKPGTRWTSVCFGISGRSEASRVSAASSAAATTTGRQPNSGKYLTNFALRCTPDPPWGGKLCAMNRTMPMSILSPVASAPIPLPGSTLVSLAPTRSQGPGEQAGKDLSGPA